MLDVRDKGDAALKKYTEQFDGVVLSDLKVTAAELIASEQTNDRSELITAAYSSMLCVMYAKYSSHPLFYYLTHLLYSHLSYQHNL